MKASATALAQMKNRAPTGVRRAMTAITSGSSSPHSRMRQFRAARRSLDTAQAISSSTRMPTAPTL